MIHHHECNVAMSEDALKNAKHPELRAFAQQTIDLYNPEIEQMKAWRKAWLNQDEPTNQQE